MKDTQTLHTGVVSKVYVKICEVRIWELVLCFPFYTTVNPDGILIPQSYGITSLYIFSLCKVDKRQDEIQNTTLNTCQIFQSFHIWTLKHSILIPLFQMILPLKLINLSNLGCKVDAVILPISSQFVVSPSLGAMVAHFKRLIYLQFIICKDMLGFSMG